MVPSYLLIFPRTASGAAGAAGAAPPSSAGGASYFGGAINSAGPSPI